MRLATIGRYHELGFTIHPLCPHDHHCQSPGKIPWDPSTGKHMTGWQSHENYHMDIWDEWLDLEPETNIGMLCGVASRIVGIDLDDQGAEEVLEALGHDETWEYSTGRGRRLLFRWTEPLKSSILKADEERQIEILADGRNNVLPPSIHPSGREYAWTPGHTPRDIQEPAELPRWAREDMAIDPTAEVTSEQENWVRVATTELRQGNRNNTMTRLAGWLINPAPHTHKEAYFILKLINERFSNPPLPDHELKSIVRSIDRIHQKSEIELRKRAYDIRDQFGVSMYTAMEMARDEV